MRSAIHPLALATALILTLAACGDDDPADTTAAPSTNTDAPATTSGSTNEGTESTTAPSGDDVSGDLQELLDRFETATIRTTYRLGEGEDAEVLILAHDPNASPPVESLTLPELDSKVVITDGMTVFCDGSSSACFEVPGGGVEGLTASLLGPFAAFVAFTPIVGETSTEPTTIAGRSGVCFSFNPTVGDTGTELVRQCIDGEFGFTLLLESREAGDDTVETILELLEFSTPTDDDFALPFPLAGTP